MIGQKYAAFVASAFLCVFFIPELTYASVEGTLLAIQGKVVNVLLPLAAVLGLVYAAFSFLSGSPNARQHLVLAIIGACVGFGAQSIIALVRSLVS